MYEPLEARILLHESIEVLHELVNRFSHMHVANCRPDGISIRDGSCLIFELSHGRLELVPVYRIDQRLTPGVLQTTYVYCVPSLIRRRSLHIA